ncbi:hypothetical protein J7I98_23745 [Streptomyces sp. ISL-98]|uniref:hypothetical protein n=1 Tax=Streptomyces sp. ISL-98 TaxID=2819192 RepID=UPI001BED3C04|nr:hypothetical protein [Streptomyces sp. ISL-98]MBT2508845.1 hypothetical protein [Streptomyces sp. ISL-98]
MSSYRRHQIALTIGAAGAGLSATIMWRRDEPWAAALAIGMGVILAAASHREAAAHRADLVRHERARRAALLDEESLDESAIVGLLLVPCCQFWTATGGRSHAPRCPVGAATECPDAPPDWLSPPTPPPGPATAPTGGPDA